MKHMSVGDGPSFDFSMLKGAEKIAREDAERSVHLAQRARMVSPQDMDEVQPCRMCRAPLPENCRGEFCQRCRKVIDMRAIRARAKREARRG